MQPKAKMLALLGLCVALNVVLTRMTSVRLSLGGVEGVRIGLGALPVILAGLWWGPRAGGMVGALGDVLGYALSPMGGYLPLITVAAALRGVLPALFFPAWRRFGIWGLGGAVAVGQGAVSGMLVPLILYGSFGLPLEATVAAGLVSAAVTVPLFTFLIPVVGRRTGLGDFPWTLSRVREER